MSRFDPFRDGYTQRGFISGESAAHKPLRFTYRPALVEERGPLRDAFAQLSPIGFAHHMAERLAEKIVNCDLPDDAWQPLHPAADACSALPAEPLVKLSGIVYGLVPTDIDPDWPSETGERLLAFAAEATASRRTIGEVREEYDEKNCCWG